MDKVQLEKFKEALEAKREEIIRRAEQTLRQDMALDADDFPDEMDLASSEYLQAFTFRLRGREKVFLTKIQKALERIGNGTFGTCEECAEPISNKRLEARPETTLCIRCKRVKNASSATSADHLPSRPLSIPRSLSWGSLARCSWGSTGRRGGGKVLGFHAVVRGGGI